MVILTARGRIKLARMTLSSFMVAAATAIVLAMPLVGKAAGEDTTITFIGTSVCGKQGAYCSSTTLSLKCCDDLVCQPSSDNNLEPTCTAPLPTLAPTTAQGTPLCLFTFLVFLNFWFFFGFFNKLVLCVYSFLKKSLACLYTVQVCIANLAPRLAISSLHAYDDCLLLLL